MNNIRHKYEVNEKNILLIGGNKNYMGGLENYCNRLMSAFKKYTNIQVKWIRLNSAILRNYNILINVYRFIMGLLDAVFYLIMNEKENIIWFQYGNGIDSLAILIIYYINKIKKSRKKIVCTMHASQHWKHFKYKITNKYISYVLNKIDLTCCFSFAQRNYLKRMGIQKIVIIPTLLPDWINKEIKPEEKMGNNIIFAGRIAPEKGIIDLTIAVYKLIQLGNDIKLFIIGRGRKGFEKKICRKINQLGLKKCIFLLGNKSSNELYEIMNNEKIFVYPSKVDAFPLSVLEALACSMNVIAYGLPETAEMIKRYGGQIATIGNIDELVLKIKQSKKMPVDYKRSIKIRKELNWIRVVSKYVRIINKI